MPVAGETAVVAPVIAQVRLATAQLSLNAAFGVATDAVHTPTPVLTVIAPGHVSEGISVSVTLTVNEHVLLFPAASATVYITVVMPELKVYVPIWLIPVAADAATVAPVIVHLRSVTPQLSLIVAFGVTIDALQLPAELFAVIFPGHAITGFSVSVTVTVKEQVADLPAASLAV